MPCSRGSWGRAREEEPADGALLAARSVGAPEGKLTASPSSAEEGRKQLVPVGGGVGGEEVPHRHRERTTLVYFTGEIA